MAAKWKTLVGLAVALLATPASASRPELGREPQPLLGPSTAALTADLVEASADVDVGTDSGLRLALEPPCAWPYAAASCRGETDWLPETRVGAKTLDPATSWLVETLVSEAFMEVTPLRSEKSRRSNYFFRNRYYDPELGRFIQPDPLGYVDGPSTYQFVGYSPYNYGDPLGLENYGEISGGTYKFYPNREEIRAIDKYVREKKRKELNERIDIFLGASEYRNFQSYQNRFRKYLWHVEGLSYRETDRIIAERIGEKPIWYNEQLDPVMVEFRDLERWIKFGENYIQMWLTVPTGLEAGWGIKSLYSLGRTIGFRQLGMRLLFGSADDLMVAASREAASPGSVSWVSEDDLYFINISRRSDIDPEGFLDVIAHGYPDSVELRLANGANRTVNHRVLARLIEGSGEYSGGPVRLLSCSTGQCSTGFAQNLANKLGVTVRAPDDIIWAWPSGRLTIGPNPMANTGTFIDFSPGGVR